MKYFVKQFAPEVSDSEPYFYDFLEAYPNVIIDGGRNFKGYGDVLKPIQNTIDHYYEFNCGYGYFTSFTEFLNYYMPKKVNGKKFSTKEVKSLREAFQRNDLSQTPYEENLKTIMLSIIYGEEYKKVHLRGYCQGDVVHCYHPVSMSFDALMELEALYWNGGSEVMVHDDDSEVNDADDISGYCMYIFDYNLKRGLAKQLECKEEDIVLYEFDYYRKVPVYKQAQ